MDRLFGGDANDTLNGGEGHDVLTGGADNDYFVFNNISANSDVVTDFRSGVDNIVISAALFGGGLVEGSTIDGSRLQVGADPMASIAQGTFLFDTDTKQLSWDVDGTGSAAAVHIGTLQLVSSLTVNDFDII
jgi:Ca2+-binding RTX toxin-like protein